MLDQAFSARNFRRLYDLENRRGRNVDRRFFPNLVEASAAISAASERIRDWRRNNQGSSRTDEVAALKPLYDDLVRLRQERDRLLDATLAEVSATIDQRDFQLDLEKKDGPNETDLYPLVESPTSYFVAKQLQINISRLYKVKPGDRRMIVRQVKDLLSTQFNLFVVRTDISAFYETIDRSLLLKDLDRDQLLSRSSKSHIKCILNRYAQLSGSDRGIPRGVGVSAYLSELYLRPFDEHVRQLEGLTYYARYVDDIIAIFSPTAMDNTTLYEKQIEDALNLRSLAINRDKTKSGLSSGSVNFFFEYLGYEFSCSGGDCNLEISSKKMDRYKRRIEKSFLTYDIESTKDQRGAARRLTARIKYLTGNTRLVNSKGFAFTGIYYSNSELTKLGKLNGLDQFLRHKIGKLHSASLQDRLMRHSFRSGFQDRPFYRYSTRAIAQIVRAWKYEG